MAESIKHQNDFGMAGKHMDLKLFEHNKKAYEAANYLMNKEGKAAIIHPTGTGKSLIAFQLALEHQAERVLWLSPSAYIFRTQLENVKKIIGVQKEDADDTKTKIENLKRYLSESEVLSEDILFSSETILSSEMEHCKEKEDSARNSEERNRKLIERKNIFSNIIFLTYAKLMHNEIIIEDLAPDYIILDEFHRCGASEWGRSVKLLLETYPNAKVLGLSATNIRYLDNQRDMAEEIFDGNIASEMSLGEAIGRKILPAPTYVCAMYDYQEELKRLKKRLEQIKNAVQQKENEKLLEQLRRTLENAEGLDKIFDRHMKRKKGKYIVFCSNKEHMEEMVYCVSEWFGKIDPHPHVYKVYYDNPQTNQVFECFKKDETDHLRLLFCIDMLNEGVHVEHIDGVILLRPTVSPILYLQQIGRGLAVGNKKPLIFDLVNNFDSLYSIHSLVKEAENMYGIWDKDGEKLPFDDYFQVIDEVCESRQLFDQIKRNLSAGWEFYYEAAKQFYKENGHLNIPKKYVSANGLSLGLWLMTQRRIYAGKIVGSLNETQIDKLNEIGMVWEDGSNRKWNHAFGKLKEYKEQHGNVDIPAAYVTEDNFPLGKWVSNIRSKWKRGEYEIFDSVGNRIAKEPSVKAKLLTVEQIMQLNELGMIWDKHKEQWNRTYIEAVIYWKEHGDLEVPRKFVTEKGTALGVWLDNQRSIAAGKKIGAAPMTEVQRFKLNQIGMIWEKVQVSNK
mgnify:CR=1 FL=1